MTLTLDITGPQAGTLGSGGRKAFHDAGGTIGRLPKNDVVLADSYVSATHAVIQYKGGVFYIEDRSTNGIFINSPDNRLEKGIPYALKSGDLILIEPYEIRASIGGTAQPAAPSTFDDLFPAFAPETSSMAHDLFDPLRAFEPPRPLSPPRPALPDNPLSSDDADPSPADVDWLGLLGNDRIAAGQQGAGTTALVAQVGPQRPSSGSRREGFAGAAVAVTRHSHTAHPDQLRPACP